MNLLYIFLFLYNFFVFTYDIFHTNALFLNTVFLFPNSNLFFSSIFTKKIKNARFLGKILLGFIFFITIPIDILGVICGYVLGLCIVFFIYLFNKNMSFDIVKDFIKLKRIM